MELNFKIQKDRLIAGSILEGNSGNVGTYICDFDILENKDFLWLCVFKKEDNAYQQVIENGKCSIPKEVLENAGQVEIGCYGTKDDTRISTNWLTFRVEDGAYCEATAPEEPTPDVWEELVMNSLPYIGETGNWYVYDKEKKTYVDSKVQAKGEKGEKGDKGEAGISETKRFPISPQIDITTEEVVRYINVDELDGIPFSDYNFTCAKVLFTNKPQTEQFSTEFQAKLNGKDVYVSTPTGFLYNSKQQYWLAHFDLINCLALGHSSSVETQTRRASAVMPANQSLFAKQNIITSLRFISTSYDIPVGTNIKVWLK